MTDRTHADQSSQRHFSMLGLSLRELVRVATSLRSLGPYPHEVGALMVERSICDFGAGATTLFDHLVDWLCTECRIVIPMVELGDEIGLSSDATIPARESPGIDFIWAERSVPKLRKAAALIERDPELLGLVDQMYGVPERTSVTVCEAVALSLHQAAQTLETGVVDYVVGIRWSTTH